MLLASNISTDDSLMQDQAQMEKLVFDQLLKIKTPLCANCNFHQGHCGLHNQATQAGIELFMGTYWDGRSLGAIFCVPVHDRTAIPKQEKLIFLQNAIKDKSAKSLIAGLTKSSDHYDEAVECLLEDMIAHGRSTGHMCGALSKLLPWKMAQENRFMRCMIWWLNISEPSGD